MKKTVLVLSIVAALALLLVSGTVSAATTDEAPAVQASAAPTPTADEEKPWLGVTLVNITERLAERFKLSRKEGVVIAAVVPNSPAAKAGLKVGDVVTAVNGVAVKTPKEAVDEVSKRKPGDELTLSIMRGSESLSIKATLETAPTLGLRRWLQQIKPSPRLPSLPPDLKDVLKDVPVEERFSHNYGSTRMYKDKDGNVVTVYTIPGIVTAISPTSITITPNNPQSRGGPFTIDGTTRIIAGGRAAGSDAIAVGDQVIIVVVGDSDHASVISKVQAKQWPRQFTPYWRERLRAPLRDLHLRQDLFRLLQQVVPGTGA